MKRCVLLIEILTLFTVSLESGETREKAGKVLRTFTLNHRGYRRDAYKLLVRVGTLRDVIHRKALKFRLVVFRIHFHSCSLLRCP